MSHHPFIGLNNETTKFEAAMLENCFNEWLKECLSISETAKLNYLLTKLTLGDRAPSQLLGDNKGSAELLQSLWL